MPEQLKLDDAMRFTGPDRWKGESVFICNGKGIITKVWEPDKSGISRVTFPYIINASDVPSGFTE